MAKNSLGARLRYAFDKSMAGGTIALIGWLTVVSLVMIIVSAGIVALLSIAPEGDDSMSFLEAFWASLMRTLDPGTMGGDDGWPFRLMMLAVTIGGIFVVSALIGVLSSGLEGKLDELRKGRSVVLERDHTIIFNWSASIFDIVSELVIANESRSRPRIVIMADKDKVEMEDEVVAKIDDLKNTRIICRSGDPTDLYDIGIANPQACRSVIVLSPEGDDPDSCVIKTVLALVNDPERRPEPYVIAAEIRDVANAEVARVVGGDEVQLVLADDLIARIMVQSTRQPGLSGVYTELLDFDGCEIYAVEQPALAGKTFGQAVMAYDGCSLIGLCHEDGRVALNPPMDTTLTAGMKAILIAEDDDQIETAAPPADLGGTNPAPTRDGPPPPERTLLIGWNRRAPMVALELSRYVGPGSLLTIAADAPEIADEVAALTLEGDNLGVELRQVDTGRAADIDALQPLTYDHVLVLGYSDHMEAQPADTRTLVTLLHLRRIAEAAGETMSVVSEMIDVRNRALAEVTRVDDFVVSNKLVSLMLAQASENEHLEAIFQDLLDEEGSEICLKPASDYVPVGAPTSFYAVASAAAASIRPSRRA
jgi:voltage-gated potassium channel Kch